MAVRGGIQLGVPGTSSMRKWRRRTTGRPLVSNLAAEEARAWAGGVFSGRAREGGAALGPSTCQRVNVSTCRGPEGVRREALPSPRDGRPAGSLRAGGRRPFPRGPSRPRLPPGRLPAPAFSLSLRTEGKATSGRGAWAGEKAPRSPSHSLSEVRLPRSPSALPPSPREKPQTGGGKGRGADKGRGPSRGPSRKSAPETPGLSSCFGPRRRRDRPERGRPARACPQEGGPRRAEGREGGQRGRGREMAQATVSKVSP